MSISPFVKQSSICSSIFDHTSVLQLLAEKFTPDKPYNETVHNRSIQNPAVESISAALNNNSYWEPPPSPAQSIEVKSALGLSIIVTDKSAMAQSFEYAMKQMLASQPNPTKEKYPEIIEWQNAVNNRRK